MFYTLPVLYQETFCETFWFGNNLLEFIDVRTHLYQNENYVTPKNVNDLQQHESTQRLSKRMFWSVQQFFQITIIKRIRIVAAEMRFFTDLYVQSFDKMLPYSSSVTEYP